jgi:hypothetical protein
MQYLRSLLFLLLLSSQLPVQGRAYFDETPLVFVKEFCTYAKNFKDRPGDVASIDVSTCYLLEIYNKDERGQKTAFSLTHFTNGQLAKVNDGTLAKSLKVIVDNFERVGGDLSCAEFSIYGGTHIAQQRNLLRRRLKNAMSSYCGACGTRIQEPKDLHMSGARHTIDFIFSAYDVSWVKVIDHSDPSKDLFSKNLHTEEDRNSFEERKSHFYYPISKTLDSQTNYYQSLTQQCVDLGNAGQRKLYALLIPHVVGDDGQIHSVEHIKGCSKTKASVGTSRHDLPDDLL